MFPIIILQIENDDERDFMGTLYETYYGLMKSTVHKFSIKSPLDNDLVHEACLRLIPKISLLQTFKSCVLRAYIVSTVRSVCLNHLSKSKRETAHIYYGEGGDVFDDLQIPDEDKTVENTVLDNEKRDMLGKAIARLPERDRDLLIFKYFLELSDREIAQMFNIKPDSIRANLTKSRRKALKLLQEEGITSVND